MRAKSLKTRTAGLLEHFGRTCGGGKFEKQLREAFLVFSPEEFVQLVKLINGKNLHSIMTYTNSHRRQSIELTVDEVREAQEEIRNLTVVKEVLEA